MIVGNLDMIRYCSVIILLLIPFIYIYKLGRDKERLSFLEKMRKKSNYKKVNDIEEVKERIKKGEL